MTTQPPIRRPSTPAHGAPSASAIDPSTLPLYEGIGLDAIHVVRSPADESAALRALMAGDAIGFDTESKPTFAKGEVSDGPHLIQLSTDDKAYLFPVAAGPARHALKTILESPKVLKVGFGLRDDLRRLQSKLGIRSANLLDLAVALRQDKRGDVGAKTAVARFFGQRMQKSKRTSTTNWANPHLTEKQMLYAANDAHVALRVYRAWQKAEGAGQRKAGTKPARKRAQKSGQTGVPSLGWMARVIRFWSRLWPRRAAKGERSG